MKYVGVLGCAAVAATFAVSGLAQDAGVPKVAKPEIPAVASETRNSANGDVPAVAQPTTTAVAKPDAVLTQAVAPPLRKVSLPVSEIPDEFKSKVTIAAQHVRANQMAEALALYTEVLTAKADLFTVAVERGKVYQHMKDHAKAIADFGSALKNSSEHYEAYFRRCVSYYDTGAFAPAVEDCSKAIELNPAPAEYYYYRGLAYTALRTWDKAASDLAAATERNNQQPDAHLQLGRVYTEMDQLVAALREFTLALQQRPGYPEAYKGRSTVKAALGDAIGSQEDLSQIAR